MAQSDEKKHLELYTKLLKNDTTFEDNLEIALEHTKRLSVNKKLQLDLRRWRRKWRVKTESYDMYIHPRETHQFPPNYKPPLPSPKTIWVRGTAHLNPEQRWEMRQELEGIGEKYGYRLYGNDHGLLIVAAFYGIKPHVIIERWDQIKLPIVEYMTTEVRLNIYPYVHPDLKSKYIAIINYLVNQFQSQGLPLDLPESAEQFILELQNNHYEIDHIDWENDPEQEIILHVSPNSRLSDVSRVWKHVEFQQYRLWPGDQIKKRKWRNFERDFFFWRKVKREGLTYEQAYTAWLTDHPNDKIVDMSGIVKGVMLIDQVYI